MTNAPDDRSLRLNAAIDGELDAFRSLSLEREMQADPALAAEHRRLVLLREAVARHAPREDAPRSLVDRIAALAEPSAPSALAPLRQRGWSGARMFALAASMAAAGFIVGAGITALRMQSAAPGVASGLVSDFARADIAGQPFDVASSDRHTVKPWLAGRTTVSASIVDLAQEGFPLAGGRVSVVDRIPAPTLVYRHNEHLVAVTELPPGLAPAEARPAETIDGYHVERWSDDNLSYVAVSDMDEKTLADFVAAFRQAQKAGAGERPAP
jgi:anti-sigma factor RsiW